MRGKSSRTAVLAAGVAGVTAVAVACGAHAAQESGAGAVDAGSAPTADANILVVGMDSGPGREGMRPDTIALVHVPKAGTSAAIISLPRDLYVDGGAKFGKTKLNAVYPKALDVEHKANPDLDPRQLAQKAQEDLVSVVQDVTGARVDHYAQVDMAAFVDLSTVVGGVPVCLKHAQRDDASGADFPAGKQTITGERALAFVRQRHGLPGGDLDRIKRQQAFLVSLADTVTKDGALANPAKRNALIAAVRKYVVLDQKWDLVSFAGQVRALPSAKVAAATVPLTGERFIGGMSVLTADPAAVKDFVRAFTSDGTDGTDGGGSPSGTGKPAHVDGGGIPCVD